MTDSKTPWTPGPWRFSEMWRPPIGKRYDTDRHDAEGNVFHGYSIAGSNARGGAILPTLAAVHNFPNQCEANARLISKAPEMAAELQQFVNGVETGAITSDQDEVLESVTKRARAILTFIKGESA